MSRIAISYPGCGHGGKGTFGQSVQGMRLVWYRSYACPVCGATEEDGKGFAPENLRNALLKRDGRFKLVADGADRVAAVKVVRSALRYTVEAATTLLSQFPLLYVGTGTEAKWLSAVLANTGFASQVLECDANSSEAELAIEALMSEASRKSLGWPLAAAASQVKGT